jgi:hypothetical protein
VSTRRPLTASADRGAEMPAGFMPRIDHIARAQSSLAEESRRLERLGFEDPLRRCHEERRYWNFLAAVHGMTVPGESTLNDTVFVSTPRRCA